MALTRCGGLPPRPMRPISFILFLVFALSCCVPRASAVEIGVGFGPDFIADVAADVMKAGIKASGVAGETAVEATEVGYHALLSMQHDGNDQALDEHADAEHGFIRDQADTDAGAIAAQAGAGSTVLSGLGAKAVGDIGQISANYQNQLKQFERVKQIAVQNTEKTIQMRLQTTIEKLRDLRDDGMVHMRRRGDEAANRYGKDDSLFAKQAAQAADEAVWRLEQRALRTEKRLDRLLQETRDLLHKRDASDEARASALESQLDSQAREVEQRLAREEQTASYMRIAQERRAEAALSAQRAAALREKGQLRWRPKQVLQRLECSNALSRAQLGRALGVAASAQERRDLADTHTLMTRARKQAAFDSSGLNGAVAVHLEPPLVSPALGDAMPASDDVGAGAPIDRPVDAPYDRVSVASAPSSDPAAASP